MKSRTVVVENRLGLHARAAARLVRLTSGFQSAIHLCREGNSQEVDSKSILGVLMLAATQGTRLVVSAEGPDEDEACAAVCLFFADRLGEGN
jgi:phosphocarrier protein HPr